MERSIQSQQIAILAQKLVVTNNDLKPFNFNVATVNDLSQLPQENVKRSSEQCN